MRQSRCPEQGVLGKLPQLAQLLDPGRMEGPDLSAPQDTPYGLLSPPLGQARLKAVEVLYSILSLSDPAAEQGALLFMQHLNAEWLRWVKQWVTQPGSRP